MVHVTMGRPGGSVMGTSIERRRGSRGTWAIATALLLIGVAACGGSAGSVSSSGSAGDPGNGEPTASTAGAVPGAWQGTITFHAVLDTVKDDTSTSGQGTYQETTTTHDVTQADVTDAFTVTGHDPDDLTYGIDSVDLTGSVANSGTTLERYVFDTDKYNALGCHWTDETGTEVKGSWTHDATGQGSISFSNDGSYHINIGAGGDPVTGETPQSPQLPKRLWETNTIIAGGANDCPGPGIDETATEGPVVEWASSILGAYDFIDGKTDPAAPGSVVDGSKTFAITLPEATLTVTWHLVHDGPIVLPHE
jgi:hypothetical protein